MKLSCLSDTQLESIMDCTASFIENVGCKVEHTSLLKRLKKGGADVDEHNGLVRLPKSLQGSLLQCVPPSYTIDRMDGKRVKIGGGDAPVINAIVTDPWIIDYQTLKRRRPNLEDIRVHTLLAQHNQDVAMISRMDYPVTDVDGPTSSIEAMKMHLLHHTKHCSVYAADVESLRFWFDAIESITQSELGNQNRMITAGIAVQSPLTLNRVNADMLTKALDRNCAIIPTVCPIAGFTSPYAKDATLLQGHIENIFLA